MPGCPALRYDLSMRIPSPTALALVLAVSLWSGTTAARDGFSFQIFGGPGGGAGAADPGSAAQQAATMTGGRVLDVQTDYAAGRPRYLVKILLGDGRVKVVPIDGAPARGFRD